VEGLCVSALICRADLKPENILLAEDNHIRIIDFGTAKDIGTNKDGTAQILLQKHLFFFFLWSP
jgi:serine/threonine protein kinase